MTAPEIIHQLVKRFDEHRETYRSGKYNETQLRREFLDPFFDALGWDVFNRQGYAEKVKREIESTDKTIDRLVSPFGDDVRVVPLRCAAGMIYGLTEEEIKIIES
jgi:hypothetical protein